MRRIHASGGWAYGPPAGSQLDLLPIPETKSPSDLLAALRVALHDSPLRWLAVRDMPAPMLPRDWTGIYGISATVAARLTHPRAMTPAQALRQVEDHEHAQGVMLPADLCAALLAGARGIERRISPERIGLAALLTADNLPPHDAADDSWPKALGGKQVEALVRQHCPPGHAPAPFPALRPLDLARVALEIGRQLWEPAWWTAAAVVRTKALAVELMRAGGDPRDIARRAWLAMLAAAYLLLQPEPIVTVADVPLGVPDDMLALQTAWPNAQTMAAQDIPAAVVRALMPDGRMAGSIHMALYQDMTVDRAMLRGLAASLLREADERTAYVPAGTFRLALPPELPLVAAGVTGLAVFAEPDGLWVRLCAPAPTGPILHWAPRVATDDQIGGMSEWLFAVLAALWHDLRVAGETAIVERGRPPQRASASAPKPPQPMPTRATVRYLPPLRLSGRREWGTAVEREYVAHRAHGVRGHLRRLHSGWTRSEDAQTMADSFGVVLPDGYTFVRPFVRGDSTAGDTPAEIVVRARGLATLISLILKE